MTCNLILPPNIKKLESKVEELAGFQITYILDPSIDGNLMSEFENGLPIIRYRENMDVEGVAHELLHLKLRTQGYHSLKSWPEERPGFVLMGNWGGACSLCFTDRGKMDSLAFRNCDT